MFRPLGLLCRGHPAKVTCFFMFHRAGNIYFNLFHRIPILSAESAPYVATARQPTLRSDLHFSAAAGGAYSINWAHMEYLFILGSRLRARSDVEALCTRSQLSCTTCQRPCLVYLGCDAARKHPDEMFSTRRPDTYGAGKPSACTVIVCDTARKHPDETFRAEPSFHIVLLKRLLPLPG